jgi:protein phosphatase
MGTTMTAALVDVSAGTVSVGHVGDSRAYRIRGGELEQLTEDHSLVGELLRSGKLSPEEAEVHPQRSVITRALGTEPDVDVDTFTVPIQPGDLYLLCSDGLSTMVSDREIQALLAQEADLDRAARALIDAANEGGGEDNITVVLFEIAGADETVERTATIPPAEEPEPAAEDDADTLSGLEPTPVVDTAVIPADVLEEHLQEAERKSEEAERESEEAERESEEAERETEEIKRPPEPRRRLLPLISLLLLLLAIALLTIWGLSR